MRITIAERLRPFSHIPGTACVIPGSSINVEIFPVLIRAKDLFKAQPMALADISVDIKGPVKDFTIVQDLENGSLRVFGSSSDGYFRYSIRALENGKGIIVYVERAPDQGLKFVCNGNWKANKNTAVHQGASMIFSETSLKEAVPCRAVALERLSLGSHKQQDWELVRRRQSFNEIFPIWFCLGQIIPKPIDTEFTGTSLLLNECRKAIAANAPEKILAEFHKVFLAGFEGILSPRLQDTDLNGICLPPDLQKNVSALILLSEGAKLIRLLFIHEENDSLHILPSLPPEFHCGRLLNIHCGHFGSLSLEWTKKSIRRMIFVPAKDCKIAFHFSNHEKQCRLRQSNKDKGITYIPSQKIEFISGQNYWFDNFHR